MDIHLGILRQRPSSSERSVIGAIFVLTLDRFQSFQAGLSFQLPNATPRGLTLASTLAALGLSCLLAHLADLMVLRAVRVLHGQARARVSLAVRPLARPLKRPSTTPRKALAGWGFRSQYPTRSASPHSLDKHAPATHRHRYTNQLLQAATVASRLRLAKSAALPRPRLDPSTWEVTGPEGRVDR
jgi:hypothetical protein